MIGQKRRGQALIIVVLIIAVIMAVFANSLLGRLRFGALQETEIYQREQALYLAEMGVNQIIANLNSGITYNDGDTITGTVSGIGSFTTTYHTPDNSGFNGDSYVESEGKAGSFSRKIFASIQIGSNISDPFKYCLFTSTGGRDGVKRRYFKNYIYGNQYRYNNSPASTPYPDENYYNKNYAEEYVEETGTNPTYRVKSQDLGKVLYIHTESDATLTVSFVYIYNESYNLSIITNAKNLVLDKMGPANGDDTNWYGAKNSKDDNSTYPIVTHFGSGTVKFNFTYSYDDDTTLYLHGFIYTAGGVDMEYSIYSYGEIDGEVVEKNPQGELGGPWGDTSMKYVTDYYTNPPPHFIIPGTTTKVLPGTFREEF